MKGYDDLTPETKAIAQRELTPRQHDVFRARLNGHSWRRIGNALGMDESNARRLWERAILRMRPYLRKDDPT